MFAKINHVAACSEKYALLGKFYETVFGMKSSPKLRSGRAVTVGDGYVGFNINPRKAGRGAGLDNFGIQEQSVETAYDRMRSKHTDTHWIDRQTNRTLAADTRKAPDRNVFCPSQANYANNDHIY